MREGFEAWRRGERVLVSHISPPPFAMFFDILACHMGLLPLVLGLYMI
jgi:hypothetical protein